MAWQLDTSHSSVEFSARHMMISSVRGQFKEFSGQVHFDEQTPKNSWVTVEITADSIDTRDGQRDGHLRSPDFLNTEEFPLITFKSTGVEKINDSHGRIHGDLTIRGVSRPVVLDTEFMGKARSPWGTTNAGFSAATTIDRKDWGLTWNAALETGGVLVSDQIKIAIEVELIEQPEVQPAAA